jgi:hypothetical protein
MCKKRLKLKISSLPLIAKYAAKSSEKFNLITISVKPGTMQQYAKNAANMQSISDASQEPNYESFMPVYAGNATAVKWIVITILIPKILMKVIKKTQRFSLI